MVSKSVICRKYFKEVGKESWDVEGFVKYFYEKGGKGLEVKVSDWKYYKSEVERNKEFDLLVGKYSK